MCERLAIMDHGRILVEGTPDELKRTVGVDTIVDLKVDDLDDPLRRALGALPGVHSVEEVPGGARVLAQHEDGLLARIVHAAAGHRLHDVSITEPTLETVFIRLTGRALRD